MRFSGHFLASFFAAIVVASGCAPADDELALAEAIEAPLEPAAGGMFYEPPSGKNGLRPDEFWSAVAQESMREVQHHPLGGGGSFVNADGTTVHQLPSLPHTDDLLATYPDVVKYLVQCALPDTVYVYDHVNDATYQGWWGLAPGWLSANISTATDAQEWVSGCMIARLNATGKHVDILLEGAHPAIGVNTVYNLLYPFQESTVFANMFASTLPITNNSPAFHAYLCRENNLLNVCLGDGGLGWLDRRVCDNSPSTCGLVDLGRCAAKSGACIANGQHWECRTSVDSPYRVPTVGVQLTNLLTILDCNN
ncbi:MAG: hypothetical protein IPM54_38240 [Polyangiaceae bacterium]|nr:hypothetical protein [Polyangiaceae bacterium]